MAMNQSNQPPFNIMVFPNGPVCNVDCDYCYYLDKKDKLYPDTNNFQMSEELLEEYIKQYIDAQPGPRVTFGWQGGEPTLRGLDFFKKAIELIEKYLPENWEYDNSLQTNGLLIDDEWAQFLSDNNFLVGVSIDGTARLHDTYRKDKKGQPTHARVMEGMKTLQKHKVDYNILCVVNDVNAQHPVEAYNFFKKQGAEHVQFIPIVEQLGEGKVSSRSVSPRDYGKFLIGVFDEWVVNDLGNIFVQIFEQCVSAWAGQGTSLCVFNETCGLAAVMEHNGDVYACDHFVFPEYKLGNIKRDHLSNLVYSEKQRQFGNSKRDDLSQKCRNCDYLFICHGGCIKNRTVETDAGDKINYLCDGYYQFFSYIDPYMQEIADRIKKRQSPTIIRKHMKELHDSIWDVSRNDPCPCGSGKKYKKCCIDRK
mgnify:CR=1 FL=1